MSTFRVKLSPERTWMVSLIVGVELMKPFSEKSGNESLRICRNKMYSIFIKVKVGGAALETYRQVTNMHMKTSQHKKMGHNTQESLHIQFIHAKEKSGKYTCKVR